MREIVQELDRWRAAGDRIAVATVVATRRSAPRPIGSKLAVSEGGELAGSVSGGCVESEVVEAAREVLVGGEPRLLTFGISDDIALSVGLPCGGEIDVWVSSPILSSSAPRRCRTRRTPGCRIHGPRRRNRTARLRRRRSGCRRPDSRRPQQGRRAAWQTDLRGRLRATAATARLRRGRHRRRALRRRTRARLAHDRRGCARTLRDPGAAPECARGDRRVAGRDACAGAA
jgi:xanthine dehydrogenase accessory factor